MKTKSDSNEQRERLTTVGDFGVFGYLESRNGRLWLARGLPDAHPTLSQSQSNKLKSKGIVAYAPGSSEFQQTADCAPHAASLLPYSVVLENQTESDLITFNHSWSRVRLDSHYNAAPLFPRNPWRSNLTVIPAHGRILFTPLGSWDPLEFVPERDIDFVSSFGTFQVLPGEHPTSYIGNEDSKSSPSPPTWSQSLRSGSIVRE